MLSKIEELKKFVWRVPSEVVKMKQREIVEDLDKVCKLFYKLA